MILILTLLLTLPPVKASVYPTVAVVNEFKRQTFRFRWQIEPHEDNRRYALYYSCGKEVHSSQREIDGTFPKTSERYVEMTVLEDCQFMACVVRVTDGKAITLCDWAKVITGGPP